MKRIILILVLVALACGQALAYTGFAVGDFGGSYMVKKITDLTIDSSFVGGTGSLRSIKMLDANKIFSVGDGGFFIKSASAGSGWDTVTVSAAAGETLWAVCYSPITNTTLYACGSAGKIIKSTNSGSTWAALTSGSTKSLRSIVAVNDSILFAVGSDTTILRSNNGGTSWTKIAATGAASGKFNSVAFYGTIGYICGDNGNMFKTTDTYTWKRVTFPASTNLTSLNCLSATEIYCSAPFGTSKGFIYQTKDGISWVSYSAPIHANQSVAAQKTVSTGITGKFNTYILRTGTSSPFQLQFTNNSATTWDTLVQASAPAYYRDLDFFVDVPITNRYISTLFSAQDIDSTFSYYTPPVLANNFGWFGLYVYSYGTTPRYKITLEGAPTLSDPFIAPADSIVADSCGMAGFVNQWVTLRVPPGQYFRLKYTGLSGNGANTTNTSKLYSWGQ